MKKPLSPGAHGATDYVMAATLLTAPTLLHTGGRARSVFALMGATQATVNGLTAQPYAVKPLIPFTTHRWIDLASIPVFTALPVLAGATKNRRATVLWACAALGLVAEYLLTDWDAPTGRR